MAAWLVLPTDNSNQMLPAVGAHPPWTAPAKILPGWLREAGRSQGRPARCTQARRQVCTLPARTQEPRQAGGWGWVRTPPGMGGHPSLTHLLAGGGWGG